MRFECQNPKLWQFEDLRLLSRATLWSNFKTNILVIISTKFSTWIQSFFLFEEQKISTLNYAIFEKIWKNFWSQTMLLSMLDILTRFLQNYSQAFLSYLLFRFKNSLLRHHLKNSENIFDTIQDFLISPILKNSTIGWDNLEISADIFFPSQILSSFFRHNLLEVFFRHTCTRFFPVPKLLEFFLT